MALNVMQGEYAAHLVRLAVVPDLAVLRSLYGIYYALYAKHMENKH